MNTYKTNLALLLAGIAALGALGHLAYVMIAPKLAKTPQHIVCLLPPPQHPLEFDTADAVSFGGESLSATFANGEHVQLRFGSATCFAVAAAPAGRQAVSPTPTTDAGPAPVDAGPPAKK